MHFQHSRSCVHVDRTTWQGLQPLFCQPFLGRPFCAAPFRFHKKSHYERQTFLIKSPLLFRALPSSGRPHPCKHCGDCSSARVDGKCHQVIYIQAIGTLGNGGCVIRVTCVGSQLAVFPKTCLKNVSVSNIIGVEYTIGRKTKIMCSIRLWSSLH